MRKLLALILGKVILWASRNFKIGGGSAAPGLWALKIYPELISDLASQIPHTVIITGTNGKTTTARLLAHFAHAQGLKVIRNSTGSNLARGIASALIANYKLRTTNYEPNLAIWELDEAAFNSLAPQLHPQSVVFLNAFRDQLDRYGEVDTVIEKWRKTLEKLGPDTQVFINGDSPNLQELGKSFPGKAQNFSVRDHSIKGEKTIRQTEKTKMDLEAKNIRSHGLEKTEFEVNFQGTEINFSLLLPGVYNIYNFLAAFSLASLLNIPPTVIRESLETFSSAFGRGEIFGKNKQGYIMLIKNPVGATQVFQTISEVIGPEDRILLALNDNLADGTDVSWIWDANFEILRNSSRVKSRDYKIIISGTRADDLAVRLKYAGFEAEQLNIELNLEKAFRDGQRGLEGRLFVLPTYTAMLELQKILTKSGAKKHYWKEDK